MQDILLSVGIDIGTSTTQLVFSKLFIENIASNFSIPKVIIKEKKIIYRSDIYFTPLKSPTEIDGIKVREIIEKEYEKAGIKKSDINTGAIIITGETARKENAKEVLENLSGFAGDFVVATAGPDLESIISGKGAGAHTYSKEKSTTVVNLDIGGGTSNLALFDHGEVIDTGCLDIGGRLIKLDKENHQITYLSEKMKVLIEKNHLKISIGMTATRENLKPVIDLMVKGLMQSIGLIPRDDNFPILITNKTIELAKPIHCVSFSGGVADIVYSENEEPSDFKFGDIGVLLGQAIKESPLCSQLTLLRSIETIRATVVGAGTHTMEISGSTITYTQDVFPIKNLPIIKLTLEEETDTHTLANAINKKLEWFLLEGDLQKVAIAIEGKKSPTFEEVSNYARGLYIGVKPLLEKNLPLIIVVEHDMAKVLGQTLYRLLDYKRDVICIDSIKLENGDYIDIGKPVAFGSVLPVVVKTLIFNK